MKKITNIILGGAMLMGLCSCGNTNEKFANGVEKISKDLYTVTIKDEYDIHAMDDFFKGKYYDENYVNYYKSIMNASGGACSGARNGNIVGRTYDWYYMDSPAVIVKTTSTENRLASISCFSGVYNTSQVENDEVNLVYSLISNDGINEAGVSIQQNVVQLGDEVTTGTNPNGQDLMALLVPRYVLDNAHSVDEAIELLKGVNIYATYSELMVEEFHWLISDKNKSVVVEMVNNSLVFTESKLITNFYVNNEYFDGTIDSLKKNQPTAMGWRRYYLLKDGLENVKSVKDMFNHMSKVFYAKAYDKDIEDYWYDEGYGSYDFDNDGVYEVYFDMLNESNDNEDCKKYRDYYCGIGHMKEYDNGTWFTQHVSIFDLDKKEMTIVVDEQGYDSKVTFSFSFNK